MDKDDYSLFRALNACASRSWAEAKLEKRVSDMLAEQAGRPPQGFFVPARALLPPGAERRDVEKTGTASGAGMVATDLLPMEFVELLRPVSRVIQAGARLLPGLVGDVDIPRQTAGATAGWLAAEGSDAVGSNLVISTISLSPRTVGVFTDITRRMQKQSSRAIEDLVREDIRRSLATMIDIAAINGSGAAGQPTGILQTSGIGSVTTGGGCTWAELVEFETDVAAATALSGKLAYLAGAAVGATLKTTSKDAGSGRFLLENGRANDYPFLMSENVPASTMIFGNWADLLIGMWGALDLFSDPYTLGNSGGLRVRGFQDIDIALRHAAAFSAATDI